MQIDDESKPLKKRKMDDKSKPLKKRKWSRTRNENNWAFNFKRPLLAWEEDELQRFCDALGEGPELRLDSTDSILWKADPVDIFSVKDTVNWCESSNGPALQILDLIWHNLPFHLKPNFSLG
ncbi:uncharacterized protein LOC114258816 isoform X1 [Camellia sinensis]|uniref:uncharacterized protein LOC114258816 isoform X1 n=1 Tax=Camellia sinensis TaxID=4442 RepID=UPI00103551C7|nr:uncharacterized protein LOC114258816 isoform X1 [Camellia sinensis]